jgi:fatty-acyl-CoA synthase
VRNSDEEDVRLRISRDITARVNHQVGHAPREVRLFPAGTLPKTSSGKLRRNHARELLSTSKVTDIEPATVVDSRKPG